LRVTVSDVVSPSYFVALAAVELGYFKAEGVDAEFVLPPPDGSKALRAGEIDFLGASPYVAFMDFPGWREGKVLCALSQHTYWFLAVRAALGARKGDVNAVKGLRLSASAQPGMALQRVLKIGGIDFARDNVRIVPPPRPTDHNHARVGAQALDEDLADGFWGNGMRAEYAVRRGLATVLLDVRRGDGPKGAEDYTFPALVTTEQLTRDHPEAAAGAVRAIVKTQQALRADPALSAKAAARLFPTEEAGMITELITRDLPFFDAAVTREAIAGASQFAQALGLLKGPVSYEQVVATELAPLWKG